MEKKSKRRNIFIKKDLQGKYIFSYFVFVVLGAVLFTLLFSYMSYNTLSIVYDDYTLKVGNTPSILFNKMLSSYWLFIVFGGIVIIAISMFLTHRLAGPIYKFEKSLDEMIRGNIGVDIYLRDKDEGKELSRKINEFNSMLSIKLIEISNLVNNLDNHLLNVTDALKNTEGLKDSDITLKKATSANKRIKEIIDEFTLKGKEK